MTALLTMGMGIMMTAVAVFIAGLVFEAVLLALTRSMGPAPNRPTLEQAGEAVVIHLRTSENSTGMADLLEEAA